MKIGILTYHWAINYGALLQTICLQDYLRKEYPDCNIEVINYVPPKMRMKFLTCFISRRINTIQYNIKQYKKNVRLKKDRNMYLKLSSLIEDQNKLIEVLNSYDLIICGSDQIWSPYYAKQDSTYYLTDPGIRTNRISYAASFGVYDFDDKQIDILTKSLRRFSLISVREQSALDFLNKFGINSVLVPDPTLLHDKKYYERIFKLTQRPDVIAKKYFVREEDDRKKEIVNGILKKEKFDTILSIEPATLKDWISDIINSSLIITNSYHCMIICLIFNIKFYLIFEDRKLESMNDRFITLFNNLSPLIKADGCEYICSENINYDNISLFRQCGREYLKRAYSTICNDKGE